MTFTHTFVNERVTLRSIYEERRRDEPGSSRETPHWKMRCMACMPVNIVHPDGVTGAIIKPENGGNLTTDENGKRL